MSIITTAPPLYEFSALTVSKRVRHSAEYDRFELGTAKGDDLEGKESA
jgi:hypothetical protein